MKIMEPANDVKFETLKSTIGREQEYQKEVQPREYADKTLTIKEWDKEFEKYELKQTLRAKKRLSLIEKHKRTYTKKNWNRCGELDNVFDSLGNFMGRFSKSQTSNCTGEEISGLSFRDLNLNAYDRNAYDRKDKHWGYLGFRSRLSEGREKRQDLFAHFCGSQLEERAKKRERKRTNRTNRTNRVESCEKKQKVRHDERQKKCSFNPISELVQPFIEEEEKEWDVFQHPTMGFDDDIISDDEQENLWLLDPELDEWEHEHGHLWGGGADTFS